MKIIEEQVFQALKENNITLTTAESATGGMIASTLVNVPGMSNFFQEGYVTYSDDAKVKLLGLSREIINHYGVVSKETAQAMAVCAAKTAGSNAALSVTGVAGPDGGTLECPVGTMYIACFYRGKVVVEHHIFTGDRLQNRTDATKAALLLLLKCIESGKES